MSALPEILDAAIIRNPQPDDVLVLRVAPNTSEEQAAMVRERAADRIGCRVVVITTNVELASFTGDVA